MDKPSVKLEPDYEDMDYTIHSSSQHSPPLLGDYHDFIPRDLKLEDDIADNSIDPSYQHRLSLLGGSQNDFIHRDLKLEDDIADNEKGDDDSAEANRLALQKAKSLSFGSFVYEGMKEQGKDSGTDQLVPYHNFRLRGILEELTSQHRWKECAGVLSVLLKGSVYDNYYFRHQFKYWAALETLKQIEGAQGNEKNFINLLGLLEAKQPDPKLAINKKLRPNIRLEKVLYLMSQRKLDGAKEESLKVLREQQFRDDPVANMVHGLILYQKWFDDVSEELQLKEHDMFVLSEDMKMSSLETSNKVYESVKNSHPNISKENSKENLFIMSDSDSSIGNRKEFSESSGYHSSKKQCRRGPIHGTIENRVEGFYEATDEEVSSYDCGGISERKTVLCSPDLDRILFPIRLPVTQEQMKYMIPMDMNEVRGLHLDALKHFKVAISSSPPLLAALVPYVQLLLANGQVKEAWKEIEKLCHASNHSLPFSLRVRLAESMTPKQPKLLARCYEELLCKNPASNRSIKCLIKLHKQGNYQTEPLVEYIALHLDAACGCTHIWREFASCFQEIQSEWQAEHESDRLSTIQGNYSDVKHGCLTFSNQLPRMFLKTQLRSNWILRCKWWAGRHFSTERMYLEQQEVGDWELMTFKAACASHILGPTSKYVNEIYAALERMEEKNMLSLLKPHIHCSLILKELLCNA